MTGPSRRSSGIVVIVVGVLWRLSVFERMVGWLSGSVLEETGKSMDRLTHFFGSDLVGNSLLAVGIAVIAYRPLLELWLWAERDLFGIQASPQQTNSQAAPAKEPSQPIARPKSPETPPARKFPMLGWSDTLPAIGSGIGQLGSAPIGDVMVARQRIRAEKLVGKGLGKYSFPEPVKCPRCQGRGNSLGRYSGICEQCGGTGELPGELMHYPRCLPCNGTGSSEGKYSNECSICQGLGVRGLEPELLRAIKLRAKS